MVRLGNPRDTQEESEESSLLPGHSLQELQDIFETCHLNPFNVVPTCAEEKGEPPKNPQINNS